MSLGVEQGVVYAIESPTGVRAVINDATDPDYVGYLTSPPTGLERAGVRESADVLPEADGGVHGRFLRDRLAFTLQGIIPPDGGALSWPARQDRLLEATDALRADALLLWTPSEGDPVQVSFREQQPTRITDRRPKTFLVAGVSEDPGVYSQALHEAIVAPAPGASAGGFRSPLTSPLVSGAGVAGSVVAHNAGRGLAWPILTIVGPCTNPSVLNFNTGEVIYFNAVLAAGESLVIDTNPRRRTVRFNGVANRYRFFDSARSDWWALVPGDNDVRVGFATYSAGARLTVQWRDAWG